jgi:NAD(P)-dependent dehydrogenase (short-subunit alcohol dehydrogenase family)
VVGGSTGVGRALVEQLAARGDAVLAAARGSRDLDAVRDHCFLRFGAKVHCLAIDVAARNFDPRAFVDRCVGELGGVSHVFLPVGGVDKKDTGVPPGEIVEFLTAVNYVGPARLVSAFCGHFSCAGGGTIMAFTSIAAAAPRGHNAAYGAAKRALEFY